MILVKTNTNALTTIVERYLNNGWKLAGGVTTNNIVSNGTTVETEYMQAIYSK